MIKKSTKVFSVFPACGKSYLYKNQAKYNLKILDSDSSSFSWTYDGLSRNPDFPNNYIKHLIEKISSGIYDYIFVSSHNVVQKAMIDENIKFDIVIPNRNALAEWVGRCYLRELNGNNGFPISVLIDNWDRWLNGCVMCKNDGHLHVLRHGEYLEDIIIHKKNRIRR